MADYRKRLSDMTDEERAEVAPGSAAYGNFLGKAESGKPLSVQMAEVGVEFTPVGTVSGVLDIKEELESEDPDYTDVALMVGTELLGLTPVGETGSKLIGGVKSRFKDRNLQRAADLLRKELGNKNPRNEFRDLNEARRNKSAIPYDVNERIWNETGWYVDPLDGQWRYEIDDSQAKMFPKGFVNTQTKNNTRPVITYEEFKTDPYAKVTFKLGDILSHDELYKNYPKFKDADVELYSEADNNILGWFSQDLDRIGLNAARLDSNEELKSTLLHEIQHMIQKKEGFSRGSNKSSDEVLARLGTEKENEFARYGNLKNKQQQLKAKLRSRINAPTPQVRNDLIDQIQDLEREIQSIENFLKDDNTLQYALYRGAGGEIEARLVQRRMNLTSGERAADQRTSDNYDFFVEGDSVGGFPLADRNIMIAEDSNLPDYAEGALDVARKIDDRREPGPLSFFGKLKRKYDDLFNKFAEGGTVEPEWDLSSREYDGEEVNVITFKDGKELNMIEIHRMFEKHHSALEPIPGPETSREILNFLKERNPTREEFIRHFSAKRLNKGGINMNQQMSFAFEDGGLRDDGMEQDPVSGNEVPPGSTAKEVRDDIPAQLSEGEYIVPADVVRYYGVKFFEDLRDRAKMGLQEMEANGRIGGEPVPAGGPMNDDDLSPEEMAAIREMMGMAKGGAVNMYKQQQDLYTAPNQAVGNNMNTGGQVRGYAPGGFPVGATALSVMPGTNTNGNSLTGAAQNTGQNVEQQILTAGQQAQQNPFTPAPLGSSLFPSSNTKMAEVTTPKTFTPVKMINLQTNHEVVANTQKEFDDYISKGYIVDDGTLKPKGGGSGDGGGGGGTPTETERYKEFVNSVQWNSEKAVLEFINGVNTSPMDKDKSNTRAILGGIIGGIPGAIIGGLSAPGTMEALTNIAQLKATQMLAKEKGFDGAVNAAEEAIADIIKNSPGIIDKLDDSLASGKSIFAAIQKSEAYQAPTVKSTPVESKDKGKTPLTPAQTAASLKEKASNAKDTGELKALQDAAAVAQKAADTGKSIAEVGREMAPSTAKTKTATEEATGGQGNQGLGSGAGGMNKGGLMAKGKKKKK